MRDRRREGGDDGADAMDGRAVAVDTLAAASVNRLATRIHYFSFNKFEKKNEKIYH